MYQQYPRHDTRRAQARAVRTTARPTKNIEFSCRLPRAGVASLSRADTTRAYVWGLSPRVSLARRTRILRERREERHFIVTDFGTYVPLYISGERKEHHPFFYSPYRLLHFPLSFFLASSTSLPRISRAFLCPPSSASCRPRFCFHLAPRNATER